MSEPYYADDAVTLFAGDCLDVMRGLPTDSVDAVVTDPPAGISFMGKAWDGDKGGRDKWTSWLAERLAEALRVAKPGAHAFVWALPRTSGWTQRALEDAGREVRDCVTHLFGSGFPKSLDVSKAIDGMAGVERSVAWQQATGMFAPGSKNVRSRAAVTEDARTWQGWGTALKPASEHWWLARKPFLGTVAGNVLTHGTGALNIDACRIGDDGGARSEGGDVRSESQPRAIGAYQSSPAVPGLGRWPTNVVLDGSQAAELDRQSGISISTDRPRHNTAAAHNRTSSMGKSSPDWTSSGHADSGGVSRFFPTFKYEAKAPTHERPRVSGDGEGRVTGLGGKVRECNVCGTRAINSGATELTCGHDDHRWVDNPRAEHVAHPTVKPLDLMRWLVRLVTPPGGIILDPFAGSGTTAEAAVIEGFRCILIEREPAYLPLIVARLTKPIQPDMFGGVA